MTTKNIWIVAPVRNSSIDISEFLNNLTGNFVTPETYEKINFMTGEVDVKPYPNLNRDVPSFYGKIILVAPDGYPEFDGVITLTRDGERPNISLDWNAGVAYAKKNGATHILIMNGPNTIDPFIVKDAADVMENGFVNISDAAAFMIDSSLDFEADQQFRIWFSDNDIFRRFSGSIYRPEYLSINDQLDPEEIIKSITDEDHEKYSAKWAKI